MSVSSARTSALLVAPAFVVLVLLFLIPFGLFLVISFWRVRLFDLQPALTFDNYVEVVTSYIDIVVFTVLVGLAIGLAVSTLAFSLAYVIRFVAGSYGPPLLFALMVTMFGGYLVKIYAWKTILGSNGILMSILQTFGITDQPQHWFIYNPGAVVIALTHFLLPLATLPIYAAMRGIDSTTIEAARDLGASEWRSITSIILPQCQHGLVVAIVFSFIVAAGDFVTPTFVGGPHSAMIGLFIHSQFAVRFNWPLGAAMAFTVLIVAISIIAVVRLATSRLQPRW
jgi:spermidine/putrescine transport system permease protein